MPNEKLSPEGEVIAAYGAATLWSRRFRCSSIVKKRMKRCSQGNFPLPLPSTWK